MTGDLNYYDMAADVFLGNRNKELNRTAVAEILGEEFQSENVLGVMRGMQLICDCVVKEYEGSGVTKKASLTRIAYQRLLDAGGVAYHCGYGTYVFDMAARLGKRRVNHNQWPVLGPHSRVLFAPQGDPAAEPEPPVEAVINAAEKLGPQPQTLPLDDPTPPWAETVTLIHEDGDTLILKYKGEVLVAKVVSRT